MPWFLKIRRRRVDQSASYPIPRLEWPRVGLSASCPVSCLTAVDDCRTHRRRKVLCNMSSTSGIRWRPANRSWRARRIVRKWWNGIDETRTAHRRPFPSSCQCTTLDPISTTSWWQNSSSRAVYFPCFYHVTRDVTFHLGEMVPGNFSFR